MIDKQRIAYDMIGETFTGTNTKTTFSDTTNKQEKESLYDLVIKNIASREKDALSKFRSKVFREQETNANDSAKYSSAKGKKKPTAVVYAKVSKENAMELQNELVDAQKKLVNDLWQKQENFLKENTKNTF